MHIFDAEIDKCLLRCGPTTIVFLSPGHPLEESLGFAFVCSYKEEVVDDAQEKLNERLNQFVIVT
jgi:hypothetical protein